MGYLGELPGMYYDSGKGKYFKIQANGTSPASSAYSPLDVKRRKLEDERKQTVQEKTARQKGRIRGSIRDPMTAGILAREYGKGKQTLDGPQILASGLVPQSYNGVLVKSPFDVIFTLQRRADLGSSVMDIRTMSADRLTLTQIGTDLGGDSRFTFEPLSVFSTRLGHSGMATSMSVHEESQKLVVTWMAESPNSGIAVIPASIDNEPTPNIILGPGRSRGREVDIYSSTAAPQSSSNLFAIGTSAGIMTIDKQNIDAKFLRRELFPNRYSRDVFALEFLSQDPSVLMSGGRNGILNITDLRIPDFGNQGDIIKHQSSITHIKQLDSHRIIVAGLESTLCQYDLRFRKGPKHTQSILLYPDYQNTASIRIGFDVDIESGIVAAAQEHDISHPPVQLFSLHGGHTLQSDVCKVGLDAESNHYFIKSFEVIPCIRFVPEIEGGMKSLYISSDVIRKYGWGSRTSPKHLHGIRIFP